MRCSRSQRGLRVVHTILGSGAVVRKLFSNLNLRSRSFDLNVHVARTCRDETLARGGGKYGGTYKSFIHAAQVSALQVMDLPHKGWIVQLRKLLMYPHVGPDKSPFIGQWGLVVSGHSSTVVFDTTCSCTPHKVCF